MKKRVFSLMLVLVMMLTMIPMLETEAKAEERYDVINTNNITGEAIIEHAKNYLGVPYTNSTNLTYRTGYGSQMAFDCSGFVFRVLKDLDISSNKKDSCGTDKNGKYRICADLRKQVLYGDDISAAIQKYNDTGDYSGLKPGDLMVTGYLGGSLSHVVFYAGNGQIIHCESTEGCVAIHSIERYRKGYNGENWFVDGARLLTCEHKYDNVGHCSRCNMDYNFLSTKDTGVAGKYKITLKSGTSPRVDKPYSASTNKADNIPAGEIVDVLYSVKNHFVTNGKNNEWYYISYKDIKGYVSADNMTKMKTFTTKFNPNGGTCEISELHTVEGNAIGELPIPTLPGYKFEGWFSSPYGGGQATAENIVIGNGTMIAHWKHAGIKIEFDYNGAPRSEAKVKAQVNGVNIDRAGEYLVVYNKSLTTVNTNIYGCEIAVDATGLVVGVRKYGETKQLTVPYGGFVLSGQHGWHEGATEPYGGYVDVKKIIDMGSGAKYVYFDYESGYVYAYENYADYIANHKYVEQGGAYGVVEQGKTYGVLPVPELDGHYFNSWVSMENYGLTDMDYFTPYIWDDLTAVWVTENQLTPEKTVEYNGNTYEIYLQSVSWTDAKAICEAKGGHLVTITSADEQNAVLDLLKWGVKGLYYIGCSDAETEGTWKWVTGERFSYTNWDNNSSEYSEPTGTVEESYGAIMAKDNPPNKQTGEWLDVPDIKYGSYYDISNTGFICEYDSAPCAHADFIVEDIVEPTYEKTGSFTMYCRDCGIDEQHTMPVLNKTDYEYFEANPTCEEGGTETYSYNFNELMIQIHVPVSATGHRTELKNEKAATCLENGYTGDEVCKICGKTIKAGESIKATGHEWDDGKVIKEPTETDEGTKRYTCSVCKTTKDESIPVIIHKHEYNETVIPPTCTEQGYTLYECACGESYKDNYVDSLGHDTELKNIKEATCEAEGYTGDEICKKCGKTVKNGDKIKAKGHSMDAGKITKEPTETADGVKLYTCTVCGKTEKEVVPKKGHEHAFKETIVKPTCTEGGYTLHKCSCGESYKDTYTDALGHSYKNGKCTVCGAEDPVPTPMVNPFNDVAENDYFYAPVMWAVEKGVTGGTSPVTFSPNNPCTRGQVVTFLWAASGKPAPKSSINPFTDVSESDYYYKAVLWAVENGITGGIGEGMFGPNNPCTRAQVATFLWKSQGGAAVASANSFSDVTADAYYYKAVLWAVENGVTGGVGGGMFGPDRTCTRGQIATFLYKALTDN